jgi:hypothetical protein
MEVWVTAPRTWWVLVMEGLIREEPHDERWRSGLLDELRRVGWGTNQVRRRYVGRLVYQSCRAARRLPLGVADYVVYVYTQRADAE